MRQIFKRTGRTAIAGLLLTGLITTTSAEEVKGDLVLGAQLYDNWPVITKAKPKGNHMLYPKDSKKTGVTTWRCKECHGWDYVGKEGRYSKGSHFTGIKGILDIKGQSQELTRKALTNVKDHDFSSQLSEKQLSSLILFMMKGVIDMKQYITDAGKIKGDSANGKKLYIAACSSCHWTDGNLFDLNEGKEGIQGVGAQANSNPQETLHKIRWGSPGSDMPSAIYDEYLDDQETADILRYIMTLK